MKHGLPMSPDLASNHTHSYEDPYKHTEQVFGDDFDDMDDEKERHQRKKEKEKKKRKRKKEKRRDAAISNASSIGAGSDAMPHSNPKYTTTGWCIVRSVYIVWCPPFPFPD